MRVASRTINIKIPEWVQHALVLGGLAAAAVIIFITVR